MTARLVDPTSPTPVAQYVRMSTEHQRYSTANQAETIGEYARARNFRVVQTYSDQGCSGLNIRGRPALQQLLADVALGSTEYRAVLVYDISRWGRFQDADESAYYEYSCRRAGIQVHYCAEQFENDGGPAATIIKGVKRAMAGEYSRELSRKVYQGKRRLIELGYRQGGAAGYGLRRMMVDAEGKPKGLLGPGEYKSLQTDRVVLVPGPEEEIRVVRRMYGLFVNEGWTFTRISEWLNSQGLASERGTPWTLETVREVLTNEKYVGTNVFGRYSYILKQKCIQNHPETWLRREGAFPAIIAADLFKAAQQRVKERRQKYTDEQLIELARDVLQRHGRLSGDVINADASCPHYQVYIRRFGGLRELYRILDYTPRCRYEYVDIDQRLDELTETWLGKIARLLERSGARVNRADASGVLRVNGHYDISLLLARRCLSPEVAAHWSPQWVVSLNNTATADITVIGRMNGENESPADFYLLPRHELGQAHLLTSRTTDQRLRPFWFPDLWGVSALAACF